MNNVDNTEKLKHLSLCTGYGGIDLGLKRALGAIESIAYVEIEAFAVANLVAKIENKFIDPAPIWTNLKTLDWSLFRRRVDILSGGFPCQPFSGAGRRKGDQDERHLFPFIKRGIEISRPSLVFLENVEGILSSKLSGDSWSDPEGTPVLLHVLRELERIDYTATFGIFSASEIGAPHQRKRVFILAVSNETKQSSFETVNSLIDKSRGSRSKTIFPAYRGQEQFSFEPSRTVGNAESINADNGRIESRIRQNVEESTRESNIRSSARNVSKESFKSPVGRNAHGDSNRLDFSELYQDCDNRTDELRLLGNGVVPDTAERAFRVLWKELGDSAS
jgi:DNA-cytosine methyltransferase